MIDIVCFNNCFLSGRFEFSSGTGWLRIFTKDEARLDSVVEVDVFQLMIMSRAWEMSCWRRRS